MESACKGVVSMALRLKAGVRLKDLQPQVVLAALVVERIYEGYRVDCVITSANDSRHGTNSLHYKGCAIDIRTKTFGGDKEELRNEIAEALGDEFDVVIEDLGGLNEHMHIEWDPR